MEANYVVFEDGSRHSMLRSVISEDLTEELKGQEHVNDAAPMGSQTAVLLKENATADDEKMDVSLIGVRPGKFLEPEVIEGDPLVEGENLSVIANDTLKNQGIELGSTLEIEGTDKVIEVVGFVENESFNHLPAIYMTMERL